MSASTGRSPMRLHGIGAVVEGVEVRSSRWYVGVCRLRSGELIAARGSVDPLDAGAGSWPFVRGIVCQLRQWSAPVSPRDWSAAVYENDAMDERAPAPVADGIWRREELPRATRAPLQVSTLLWAVVAMAVPQLLAAYTLPSIGVELPLSSFGFQLVTALITLLLVLVYLRLVGRLPEARRVMAYNTAALKALVAYETGAPLTPEAARRKSPIHPWSAASYIGFALALLPAIFYASSRALVTFHGSGFAIHAAFVALKVAFLPALLAVTYEVQLLAVRLFRAGYFPRSWPIVCALQHVVIVEPDDEQLEVAVSALREAMTLEGVEGRAAS